MCVCLVAALVGCVRRIERLNDRIVERDRTIRNLEFEQAVAVNDRADLTERLKQTAKERDLLVQNAANLERKLTAEKSAASSLRVQLLRDGSLYEEFRKALRSPFTKFEAVTGDEPEWTNADAEAWKRFIGSDTGTRFRLFLNFHEQRLNRQTVRQSTSPERDCGFAHGWHECAAFLLSKLPVAVPPKEDETEKTQHGGAALLERVSP